MLKIPSKTWSAFARIVRLPGTQILSGLQEEIVPTQDLSRVMQADRVRHVAYGFTNTPAASANSDLQWNDFSDWTVITTNGLVASGDAELPQPDEHRIITAVGLQISAGGGDYTSAEMNRFNFFPVASLLPMAEWGAVTAGHNSAQQSAPALLPQQLAPGENSVRLTQIVTGATAVFNFTVQMIVAEYGVMAAYPGV